MIRLLTILAIASLLPFLVNLAGWSFGVEGRVGSTASVVSLRNGGVQASHGVVRFVSESFCEDGSLHVIYQSTQSSGGPPLFAGWHEPKPKIRLIRAHGKGSWRSWFTIQFPTSQDQTLRFPLWPAPLLLGGLVGFLRYRQGARRAEPSIPHLEPG